jgi:hypothetical protein
MKEQALEFAFEGKKSIEADLGKTRLKPDSNKCPCKGDCPNCKCSLGQNPN